MSSFYPEHSIGERITVSHSLKLHLEAVSTRYTLLYLFLYTAFRTKNMLFTLPFYAFIIVGMSNSRRSCISFGNYSLTLTAGRSWPVWRSFSVFASRSPSVLLSRPFELFDSSLKLSCLQQTISLLFYQQEWINLTIISLIFSTKAMGPFNFNWWMSVRYFPRVSKIV